MTGPFSLWMCSFQSSKALIKRAYRAGCTSASVGFLFFSTVSTHTGDISWPQPSWLLWFSSLTLTDKQWTQQLITDRNNSHICVINGKMSNTKSDLYSAHPEFVGSLNAVHTADSLAQLDIWDIYRFSFPVDWSSGGLFFIDLSFRKQTHTPQVRHPHKHTHTHNSRTLVLQMLYHKGARTETAAAHGYSIFDLDSAPGLGAWHSN